MRTVSAWLVLACVLLPACTSFPAPESAQIDPEATAVPAAGTQAPTLAQPSLGGQSDGPGTNRDALFDQSVAPEVSGIVVSRQHPDVYWLVNDGPGTTSVVAIGSDGRTLGRVRMIGVEGRDTEDLATGPCSAEDLSPCIYVGDIGDNLGGVHPSIHVHRFAEPDPTAPEVEVITATYTYANGPRDAEALIVTPTGLPVVLSKEEGVTGVYTSSAFGDGTLTRVAEVQLPQPTFGLLTSQAGLHVTGADSTRDGLGVILRTYDSVVEVRAQTRRDAELASMARWSITVLPAPFEPQGEAIAYLADDRSYVTVSERSGRISVVRR